MIKNLCIIGGGTAGWMAASYLKSRLKDSINITIIYDHNNPVIGVGESTTPPFITFLSSIGIDYKELIKEINSTIKVGIKFTNWNGDNQRYYHSFTLFDQIPPLVNDANLIAAYEIANNLDTGAETYCSKHCDEMKFPIDGIDPAGSFALHIDGQLFSEFLKNKFSSYITVINDVVQDIVLENNKITKIICKDNVISSDFYIDASGLDSICMKKMNSDFIDMSDYLPMNSSIPLQLPIVLDNIPPYTEAFATENGWIWKTPLSNRLGLGYVYSNKFTSDQEAKEDFKNHVLEFYNIDADLNRIIRFTPGCWKEQWKGNCISIGLASGFVEPLESTNIHMIINQLRLFCDNLDNNLSEWSRKNYNKLILSMYQQTFDIIRLHYNTKRMDSKFWNYINSNKPEWILDFESKCKSGMITSLDVYNNWDRRISCNIFGLTAYTRIAYGLGLFDSKEIKMWLTNFNFYELSKESFENTNRMKSDSFLNYIRHKDYLRQII